MYILIALLFLFVCCGWMLQIAPMTACLGGIVAQECMKAVSGKFMPIKQVPTHHHHVFYNYVCNIDIVCQFLYMDMLEALPSDVPLASFAPQQCRYDDYIAVFGAGTLDHSIYSYSASTDP
jgi:hypothetical protein